MKNLFIALFLLFGLSVAVKAGTGNLQEIDKYCSENEKYCLEIAFEQSEDDSSDSETESDENETVEEEPQNKGKITFFANNRESWTISLDYEPIKRRTLVSNDGNYVVMFGDLYTTEPGSNAVVIYNGSNGRVIGRVGLSDFLSKSDIGNLRDSYSLYDWQKEPPVIDYSRSELVLSVVNPPRGSAAFFNVRIDLRDGNVLDEIVDRIPTTKYVFVTKLVEETINPFRGSESKNECASDEEIEQLSTFDFLQKVQQKELPDYPPAARAVRASGEVVFEVVVSPEGEVACTQVISGHPLLRSALKNALKKWKFEKRENKYKGNIIFAGKEVVMLNGIIIE